jgi:ribosomal-protein-alanine N-acetyltransferase
MIAIRRLVYPDIPQLVALERRTFTTPWSLGMFTLELARAGCVHLAAVEERSIRGYLLCSHYPDAWHLMNVAVDPDHRRRGIARALLSEMLAQTGHDASVTLEVRVSNHGAIALYEAFGFRALGTRKRYYADSGEDALIMWRAVGAPWEGAE